jgi:hypothetical protein
MTDAEIAEFALLMMRRNHICPLYVFWCTSMGSNLWKWFHAGYITACNRKELHHHHYNIVNGGVPSFTRDILLGKAVKKYGFIASASDLWNIKTCLVNDSIYMCTHINTRSNVFVKKQATYAFLCMYVGVKTSRDVAGVIARMVAKMYLDDYKWIKETSMYEGQEHIIERLTRERLLKWVQ